MSRIPKNLVVELSDVSKVFCTNANKTPAVTEVSLKAFCGKLLLIMGPSGSGKTTLLTLLSGLLEPTFGLTKLFGKEIKLYQKKELQKIRATKIGFIFQDFQLIEALSVLQNITIVQRFAGKNKYEAQNIALQLLQRFELSALANQLPSRLSQGQKQRVAVARAIANDAVLIIADEPTASLETTQGFEIIKLLHNLAKKNNKCVVVASHDLRIQKYADRVIHLLDGKVTN